MNTVIMGQAMYYYGNVSAVLMATCCRITMISLPFIASQTVSISYGSVIMSSILQRLSSCFTAVSYLWTSTPTGSLLCLKWSPLSHTIMLFNNHSTLLQLSDTDIHTNQQEVQRNTVMNKWNTLICLMLGGGDGSIKRYLLSEVSLLMVGSKWYTVLQQNTCLPVQNCTKFSSGIQLCWIATSPYSAEWVAVWLHTQVWLV